MAGGLIEDLRRGHQVPAGHEGGGVVELHVGRAPRSPGLEPQQHKPGVGGPGRVISPHPPTIQLVVPWSKYMDLLKCNYSLHKCPFCKSKVGKRRAFLSEGKIYTFLKDPLA